MVSNTSREALPKPFSLYETLFSAILSILGPLLLYWHRFLSEFFFKFYILENSRVGVGLQLRRLRLVPVRHQVGPVHRRERQPESALSPLFLLSFLILYLFFCFYSIFVSFFVFALNESAFPVSFLFLPSPSPLLCVLLCYPILFFFHIFS